MDPNRYFFKEDISMDNRHVERHAKSLAIKEKKIKTVIRYHFTPTRMTIILKKEEIRVDGMW